MRHLDDGQIAELIDGAAAAVAAVAGVAGETAEHLRACAACRERVEEACQVAERARAILATAVPAGAPGTAESAVPPFEEILHRAGRTRRSGRGRGSLRWLAWAATVVVAGGLGWYARGEWVPSRSARPVAMSEPAVEAEAGRQAADERRNPVPDAAAPLTERSGAPSAAAVPPSPAEPRQEGDRVGARGDMLAARDQAAAEPSPPQRQVGARNDSIARARARAAEETKAAAPPPSTPSPLPVAESVLDSAERNRTLALRLRRTPVTEVEQAPSAAVATGRPPDLLDRRIVISGEEAERVLGGSLASLDGLPVETYYRLAAEPGVIQTEQRLPGGGLLELEQRRVDLAAERVRRAREAAPPADASTSAQATVDTLEVDGLRIVARASIPLDSLRALVRRIRR